ncbi:DUF4167 domain-containing protein [Brevundimonas sp.]|uniref:DUF4167 domain-containing protein n=1 Tax=Brevundimonas sp. TaxID=1871086 RepID=UPI002FCB8C02
MKRQRGRNRKPSGGNNVNATNPNRSWDSQGPENIKVRGNAQTVYERYMQLARDAGAAGDRVLAENYTQHAEHYFRVLRALQPLRSVSEIAQRELAGQGFDIDFEDESGAQAAAIIAAQQAEERRAEDEARRQADRAEREAQRERDRAERAERGERNDRNDRNDRGERSERSERSEQDTDRDDREGGRRESRRERWERRRDDRSRRFENGSEATGDEAQNDKPADDTATAETSQPQVAAVEVEQAEPAPRAPRGRRPRTEAAPQPVAEAGEETSRDAASLPGFVTRPVALDDVAEAAPAPRRRAPRRKVEETTSED